MIRAIPNPLRPIDLLRPLGLVLVGLAAVVGWGLLTAAPAAADNPIVEENQRAGSYGWYQVFS
ncbi:MAG TPA: hypothetical protein VK866_07745, partial [Acidimicrobiales bacterium]|nr:hypothetical protein [Acidimicrobiales bacterium]